MSFTRAQRLNLAGPLDGARVRSRVVEGRKLDYIEGWFAIAEANAIFGYDGWDREMVHFEKVLEQAKDGQSLCGYVARVRLKVRAGRTTVIREGSGFGYANGLTHADAHERALKSAETDATKRALATFGNRFGLCLYDRQKEGVRSSIEASSSRELHSRQELGVRVVSDAPRAWKSNGAGRSTEPGGLRPMKSGAGQSTNTLVLHAESGHPFATNLSPEGFCSGLRQLIEACRSEGALKALAERNSLMLEHLRKQAPELLTSRREHYADVLRRLMDRRRNQLLRKRAGSMGGVSSKPVATVLLPRQTALVPLLSNASRITRGTAVDKSALLHGVTRRVRNKDHLWFVASLPCVICEEMPCHAHHLTFAQSRGLSVKVSDEFTVPLCAVHHNELHRPHTEERSWWHAKGINPLPIAGALWAKSSVILAGAVAVAFTVEPEVQD